MSCVLNERRVVKKSSLEAIIAIWSLDIQYIFVYLYFLTHLQINVTGYVAMLLKYDALLLIKLSSIIKELKAPP